MARVDLDSVAELDQPAERVEEPLGALASVDGEIGPGRVPDEQGVARQDEPRLGPAREVGDGEAAVLRAVPRRVDAAQDDLADGDLVAVLERLVRILRLGGGVDAHREPVLEREPAVPGEVVGVRVRLDHTHEPDPAALGLLEVLLDREGGIDDDGFSGVLVPDEVRRTPECVVDELREDHDARR